MKRQRRITESWKSNECKLWNIYIQTCVRTVSMHICLPQEPSNLRNFQFACKSMKVFPENSTLRKDKGRIWKVRSNVVLVRLCSLNASSSIVDLEGMQYLPRDLSVRQVEGKQVDKESKWKTAKFCLWHINYRTFSELDKFSKIFHSFSLRCGGMRNFIYLWNRYE